MSDRPEWTLREARQTLAEYALWMSMRDEYVVKAYKAGLSVQDIAAVTGHARQTIRFIVDKEIPRDE